MFKKLTNRLSKRQQVKLDVDEWIRIKIERNPSKLGKRYIAKLYNDWKLMATFPANQISDIFTPNLLQTWKNNA